MGDFKFSFEKLMASDITARSRAYGQLTRGNMAPERAERLAGFTD